MGKIMQMPKIVIALSAFMLLVLSVNGYMVWLSAKGHRDLVRPDYYDAGLEQDKIIARNNLSQLNGMDLTFIQDSSGWKAEVGSDLLKNSQCKVHWYRPDNKKDDLQLDLGMAQVSLKNPNRFFWKGKNPVLKRGEWIARLVWLENGKPIMEKSYPIRISG
jgi:hypothetical protein